MTQQQSFTVLHSGSEWFYNGNSVIVAMPWFKRFLARINLECHHRLHRPIIQNLLQEPVGSNSPDGTKSYLRVMVSDMKNAPCVTYIYFTMSVSKDSQLFLELGWHCVYKSTKRRGIISGHLTLHLRNCTHSKVFNYPCFSGVSIWQITAGFTQWKFWEAPIPNPSCYFFHYQRMLFQNWFFFLLKWSSI